MKSEKTTLEKLFPKTHKVVFLHAHCDDESFLSAGIMNELVNMGRDCYVIYSVAAIVEGQDKTIIRQEHTLKSLKLIGVKKALFMEYTEPKYANLGGVSLVNQKIEDVENKIIELLNDNGIKTPFILVSYDKNGGYGNLDHKIVHKLGKAIKKKENIVILYEITINRENMQNWIKEAKRKLSPNLLPLTSYWSKTFGTSFRNISFTYNLTDKQVEIKRKALAFHTFYNAANTFPLGLGKKDFQIIFGREYIRIA